MIRKLVAVNFKKHRHLELEFDQGLVVLVGQNAVGKTSTIRAILFALFGASAAGAKDHLTTRGAEGPMSVTLLIDTPAGTVFVERTLRNARVIAEDGTLLASGHTPVTQWIEEAYGLPAADLLLLMVSPQGDAQALLNMGATELQRTVERLARTGEIDKALDLIGADCNTLAGVQQGLGPVNNLQDLVAMTEVAGMSVKISQDAVAMAEKAREKASVIAQLAHETYHQAVNVERSRDQILTRLEMGKKAWLAAEDAAESAKKGLESVAPLAELNQKLEWLDTELRQAKEERKLLDGRYNDWNGTGRRINVLAQSLPGLRERAARHQQASERLMSLAPEQEQGAQKAAVLREALAVAQAEFIKARDAHAKSICPECQRPFSQQEAKDAEARMTNAQVRWHGLQSEERPLLKELQRLNQEVAMARANLDPAAAEWLARSEEELEGLADWDANEGDRLVNDMKQAERREASLHLQRDEAVRAKAIREGLEAELTRSTGEAEAQRKGLLGLEASLKELPEPQDIGALKADYEQASRESLAATDECWSCKSKLEADLALADKLANELERAREIEAKRDETERQMRLRMDLRDFLRKNRSDLLSEIGEGLFSVASHLVAMVGGIEGVRRSGKVIEFSEGGEWVPVSEASGFQRSLVGLSLRLALSKVFYGQGLPLLLDEATADASDVNSAKVAGLLQGMGSQVLMVSHRGGDSINAGAIIQLEA